MLSDILIVMAVFALALAGAFRTIAEEARS